MLGRMGLMGRGSAAAFVPTDISGLISWFDATDSSTVLNGSDAPASNGEGVKTWVDKSSTGVNLVQATEANRPPYLTSSDFSGAALDFDSVSGYRIASSTTSPSDTTFTAFMAISRKTGATFSTYLQFGTDVSNTFRITTEDDANTTGIKNTAFVSGKALADETPAVIAAVGNGASSNFYVNNVAATAGNPGSVSLAGITVGSFYNGAAAQDFQCAEILIYDSILSAADMTRVYNYLAGRHGI